MADKELEGLKASGVEASIFQIPETLPQEVLDKMHAPSKPADIPVITIDDLAQFDGFLFGFSTRYGTFPAQFKSFWDQTGGLWAQGVLYGKYVGLFVSTGSPNGGQETSIRNSLSTFVHHGMSYVPLGYKNTFGLQTNLEEVHGGSPWGAGTYAGGDGSRQPSELELEMAYIQGKAFGETVSKALGNESRASPAETKPVVVAAPKVSEKEAVPAASPKAAIKTERDNQRLPDKEPKKEDGKKFCGICTIMQNSYISRLNFVLYWVKD